MKHLVKHHLAKGWAAHQLPAAAQHQLTGGCPDCGIEHPEPPPLPPPPPPNYNKQLFVG